MSPDRNCQSMVAFSTHASDKGSQGALSHKAVSRTPSQGMTATLYFCYVKEVLLVALSDLILHKIWKTVICNKWLHFVIKKGKLHHYTGTMTQSNFMD